MNQYRDAHVMYVSLSHQSKMVYPGIKFYLCNQKMIDSVSEPPMCFINVGELSCLSTLCLSGFLLSIRFNVEETYNLATRRGKIRYTRPNRL